MFEPVDVIVMTGERIPLQCDTCADQSKSDQHRGTVARVPCNRPQREHDRRQRDERTERLDARRGIRVVSE